MTTTPAQALAIQLADLARELVKIAEAAPTLDAEDSWNRMAAQLRFVRALVLGNTDGYFHAMGEAFVAATQRLIARQLDAVHESRASRRKSGGSDS